MTEKVRNANHLPTAVTLQVSESSVDPVTEPDPELVDRLRMVIARLARRLRQEADVDLTPSQFAALSSIGRRGPITLGELATTERVRPPTMTRVVTVLEEAGLVERETDPSDRRVARVRTTPAGDALLARARTRRDAFLTRQLSALPAADRADLERVVALLEGITHVAGPGDTREPGTREPDRRAPAGSRR